MRTPGTAEKLSTSELPRPPVPMTPMRMVSWGLNGMSATLLPPEVWEREREAPSDASPASFNKSRREELSIATLLFGSHPAPPPPPPQGVPGGGLGGRVCQPDPRPGYPLGRERSSVI